MKTLLTSIAAVAVTSASTHAATITTSYGPAGDQAGPNFGQGITVNVGADLGDGSIPSNVYLDELTFTRTNSTTGINTTDVVYVHVYDAFTVDGDATPSAIGNLVAVSSTTVDFSTTTAGADMTWSFAGTDAVDKGTEYFYVLATNTTAATVGDSSNLATQGFRLDVGNPYSGGDALRANNTDSSWDQSFTLKTLTDPVPEPSGTMLLGLGGLALILRRRK